MKHKFQNRTDHVLEKDDYFFVNFDQFDREISLDFHSRNDVSSYTMPLDKFISSLQTSIEDFDVTELEVMKMTAAVLFTKIRSIEAVKAKENSEKIPETV